MENMFEYLDYCKIAANMSVDGIISIYHSMPDGYNKKLLGVLFIKRISEYCDPINVSKKEYIEFIKEILETYQDDIRECDNNHVDIFIENNRIAVDVRDDNGNTLYFKSLYSFANIEEIYKKYGKDMVELLSQYANYDTSMTNTMDEEFVKKEKDFQECVLQHASSDDVAYYIRTHAMHSEEVTPEFFDLCLKHTTAESLYKNIREFDTCDRLATNKSKTNIRKFFDVLDIIHSEYPARRFSYKSLLSLIKKNKSEFEPYDDYIISKVLQYIDPPKERDLAYFDGGGDKFFIADVARYNKQLVLDNKVNIAGCCLSMLMTIPMDVLKELPINSASTLNECISHIHPMLKNPSAMYKEQLSTFLLLLRNAITNRDNDSKWGETIKINTDVLNMVFNKYPELNDMVPVDLVLILRI